MTEQTSSETQETKTKGREGASAIYALMAFSIWLSVAMAADSVSWAFAVTGIVLLISSGLFGIESQLKKLVAMKS